MKWPWLAVFLFLGGCATSMPEGFYQCSSDSDCRLGNKDVEKHDCCAWAAFNTAFSDWYDAEAEKMKCKHTCPMQAPVRVACVEGACVAAPLS
ncbi:MAG: hypothetical protein V1735_04345 [Nanoarchaeota archaeon]